MKKSDLFFNVLCLPVDFLMLLLAGLATYYFRTEILSSFRPVLFEPNLPLLRYFYLVFFTSLSFIGVFAVSGLYSMKVRMKMGEELLKVIIASSAGILLVIIYIFLRQELFDSRFLVLGGWFFAILFIFIGRFIIRYTRAVLVAKYNFGISNVVIVGNDNGANAIRQEIESDPTSGYRIVKALLDPNIIEVKSAIGSYGVDEVILTHPHYSENEILDLVDLCNENHIVFKFVPNISQLLASNFSIDIFKGRPLIEIKRTSLDGWGSVAKRVVDIVGALFGLVILSPFFAIVAFAVKWETEGPVFVRLKRMSKVQLFNLLKFRSMIENAEEFKPLLAAFNERESGPLFKMRNDPRITKTGKFLRKTRIDEFPQLWNVLAGDMSLVGPRPHQPDEIAHYQKHHKKVLAIKSGITGLAQVSGSSGISFEQEVVLDSFYIDNWSLWLDFKILVKTATKMFFDRSAV